MSVLMRRASAIKSVSMYVKCLGLSALPTSALNYARRQYEHLPKFLWSPNCPIMQRTRWLTHFAITAFSRFGTHIKVCHPKCLVRSFRTHRCNSAKRSSVIWRAIGSESCSAVSEKRRWWCGLTNRPNANGSKSCECQGSASTWGAECMICEWKLGMNHKFHKRMQMTQKYKMKAILVVLK